MILAGASFGAGSGFGGEGGFSGEGGFQGDGGFSGPLSRSWSGGLGDVSEGTVAGMLKHLNKLRNNLAKARANAAHARAEFRIATANRNKKWTKIWGNRTRAAEATAAGRLDEYNAQLEQYNAAKTELAQQQQAEQAAASGGGAPAPSDGGGDEAPAPEPEPAQDGISGLFSGTGEPKYLPLGKLGTPLALVGIWYAWKKLRKRGRR